MVTNIDTKKLLNEWQYVKSIIDNHKTQGGIDIDTLINRAETFDAFLEPLRKTKVIFRKFKTGEIIALFPEMVGTDDLNTCGNYMTIGQHGSGLAQCGDTKPVTRREYLPLYNELKGLGYNLEVVGKFCSHHREARKAELARHHA